MRKRVQKHAQAVFHYEEMVYVIDFIDRNIWIVDINDDRFPILSGFIKRLANNDWRVRGPYSDEWHTSEDLEWCAVIEQHFKRYVTSMRR
jgi:hypothetical protein